jgi:hypothetical protein
MGRESKGRRKKAESRRQECDEEFFLDGFRWAIEKRGAVWVLDLVDGARIKNGKNEREDELDDG